MSDWGMSLLRKTNSLLTISETYERFRTQESNSFPHLGSPSQVHSTYSTHINDWQECLTVIFYPSSRRVAFPTQTEGCPSDLYRLPGKAHHHHPSETLSVSPRVQLDSCIQSVHQLLRLPTDLARNSLASFHFSRLIP